MRELQNPLSGAGRRSLEIAAKAIREGKVDEGMKMLLAAVADPSTAGYAHGLLGTEYLKQGKAQLAVENLTEAARLLPGSSAVHTNLGYALCLVGSFPKGEQAVRRALALNPDESSARYILGLILLNRPALRAEALKHLELAQSSIRTAHLALAVLHTREGKQDLADQQLLLYRPEAGDAESLHEQIIRAAALPQPATAFGLGSEAVFVSERTTP